MTLVARGYWEDFVLSQLDKASQIALLTSDIASWNRHRRQEPEYAPDLSGANLKNTNLRGANLKESDLSECDLRFADLEGTNFFNARLRHAKLEGALLHGATLTGCELSGVCWDQLSLEHVICSYAYFEKQQRHDLAPGELARLRH